ncbi:hypothetical protein BA950_15305 [Erythrobacter sp. SAORIC-644]|jgi:hypothetical protein|nr:hypothetical protein BA950_15305 [Erythrobacter sp. SAORIC-644]|tara:strand:+ start:54 stop:320 length:267 start_codon:yes stop_codon:yes gene_type:complete
MACPVDGTTLVMSERSSIEIDYCPTCRGVWLDRGELDKIIERSAQPAPSREPAQHTSPSRDFGNRGSYSSHGYSGRKRKKSFLEELFD